MQQERQAKASSSQAAPTNSRLFTFFDPDNWEMLVKVLDGCAVNGHYWVFSAATTDVEYTLSVTDIETGAMREYTNPLGQAADATTDTTAFACDVASAARPSDRGALSGTESRRKSTPTRLALGSAGSSGCSDSETTVCLNSSRFAVEVEWRDFAGSTGDGRIVSLRSDVSGLFWFFDADNWEMLVKVLDGCAINGHYWIFSAATTDVEYTLSVTDSVNGGVREYDNALGEAAPALTDIEAFACSPVAS